MTQQFAPVAFENRATGARLEGEFIADTGPTWLMKPHGHAVQALNKTEWTSTAPAPRRNYDNLFNDIFGGRA